jgi:hypothetical protein
MICSLKAEQNVEEIVEKSFLKVETKTSFHSLLKYLRHLGFFSKYFNGFEFRAQNFIRIAIQFVQKQHGNET